jgi:hypothetical protein
MKIIKMIKLIKTIKIYKIIVVFNKFFAEIIYIERICI